MGWLYFCNVKSSLTVFGILNFEIEWGKNAELVRS